MAVRFDAAGEHFTGNLSLGTVTQFTLCCWVNFVVDRGTFHGPWQIGNNAGTDYISLATQSTTSVLTVWDEGSNRINITNSNTFDVWRFVAVNVNGSGGQGFSRLADAATLDATATWSGASASTVIDRIVLGYGEGTGDWLNGAVQDVKLYNGVNLTPDEILALSFRMVPWRWADLAGWWPLILADGKDYSGNGRHLTGGPNSSGSTPTWVNTGTVFSGTTSATAALPASTALDDILLVFLESAAGDTPTVAGFSHVTGSPVAQGSGTTGTKLSVLWKRHDGSESNPAVTNTGGNHVIGRTGALRGCISVGDPWDGTPATSTDATSDTSGSITGYTTSVDGALVVLAASGDLPDATGTSEYGLFSNGALSSITERIDNSATAGNGGAIGVDTGVQAAAGAIGTTTFTKTNAAVKAMMAIAFGPSPFDPTIGYYDGPPLPWLGGGARPVQLLGAGGPAILDRTASDTAAASDTASASVTLARTASDTAAAADAVTRAANRSRTASDTAAATDAVTRAANRSRTASDTAAASDVAVRTASRSRIATDTAVATDAAVVAKVNGRTASDTAAASDTVTRTAPRSRTATDTAAASDAVTRSAPRSRTALDTASATDVVTRTAPRSRTASDTAAASDAATRVANRSRTATDVASATDVVTGSTAANLARTASDTAAASDTVTRTANRARTASDVAQASDAATRMVARSRTAADAAQASDAAVRAATVRSRTASDTAQAVDSVTAGGQSNLARTASDTAAASDAVTRSANRARTAADAAAASDAVTRSAPRSRTASDAAQAADAMVRTVGRFRTASDAAAAADAATLTAFIRSRTASDTAQAVDAAIRGAQLFARTAADLAQAADEAAAVLLSEIPTQGVDAGLTASATDAGSVAGLGPDGQLVASGADAQLARAGPVDGTLAAITAD